MATEQEKLAKINAKIDRMAKENEAIKREIDEQRKSDKRKR